MPLMPISRSHFSFRSFSFDNSSSGNIFEKCGIPNQPRETIRHPLGMSRAAYLFNWGRGIFISNAATRMGLVQKVCHVTVWLLRSQLTDYWALSIDNNILTVHVDCHTFVWDICLLLVFLNHLVNQNLYPLPWPQKIRLYNQTFLRWRRKRMGPSNERMHRFVTR